MKDMIKTYVAMVIFISAFGGAAVLLKVMPWQVWVGAMVIFGIVLPAGVAIWAGAEALVNKLFP